MKIEWEDKEEEVNHLCLRDLEPMTAFLFEGEDSSYPPRIAMEKGFLNTSNGKCYTHSCSSLVIILNATLTVSKQQ